MAVQEERRTSIALLVIFGLLAALLFPLAITSVLVYGIAGIISTGACAFGFMLLVMAAMSTKPSRLWQAVLIGSLIGLAVGVLLAWETSLHPEHYWNRWALFVLPIAGTCGSAVGLSKWVTRIAQSI